LIKTIDFSDKIIITFIAGGLKGTAEINPVKLLDLN
jgi:hypothetical protein